MPAQNPQRPGLRVAIDRNAEDEVFVAQIIGVRGRDRLGIVEGWNAVDPHAAPGDLFNADFGVVQMFRLQEAIEIRVNLGVGPPLNLQIPGIGADLRVRLLPQHPFKPAAAVFIAGQRAQAALDRRADGSGEAQSEDQPGDRALIADFAQFAGGAIRLRHAAEDQGFGEGLDVAGLRGGGEGRQPKRDGEGEAADHGGAPGEDRQP